MSRREKLLLWGGLIISWAKPIFNLVNTVLNVGGFPSDIAGWKSLLGTVVGGYKLIDWLLLAVGSACLLLALFPDLQHLVLGRKPIPPVPPAPDRERPLTATEQAAEMVTHQLRMERELQAHAASHGTPSVPALTVQHDPYVASSPIRTPDGNTVPDLCCVRFFATIGNVRPDAKTLRNVSAKLHYLDGQRPLRFKEGDRQLDIRHGDSELVELGYTINAEPIGFPTGAPVEMSSADVEKFREKLRKGVSLFRAGSAQDAHPIGLEFPHDKPGGSPPFALAIAADDIPSFLLDVVVDLSDDAKLLRREVVLKPYQELG